MNVYQQDADEDMLIIQWWAKITTNGEMDRIFMTRHSPGSLLKAMAPPSVMLYELDDQGIWFVAWFEPTFSGAFFSVWVDQRKRKSVEAYECFLKAADAGFGQFTTLLGVTKQEHLLPIHEKVGYTVLCKVPAIFNGLDAWLVLLDKEKVRGRIRRLRKHDRWRGEVWRPEWFGETGNDQPARQSDDGCGRDGASRAA